jgi:enoyl-CoA hydratase/carnithine racemase
MSDINTEFSDGVLRVELNRPDKKNAMTGAMYTRLAEIFAETDKDDAVRIVLWHGAGDSFCAGNDIADFRQNPPGPEGSPQSRLTNAFIAFEKPIVVAVHGVAVGGGTTMLTHCDFVYAGESARFSLPFVDLALVPEFGSSFSIPAMAGHLRAAELFLLGERFTAQHAADLGLVTRIVPDAALFETAMATARKLAAKPGGALRASKRLIKRAALGQLREAVKAELHEFVERVRSAEAQEAFAAFIEKRPPNFNQTRPTREHTNDRAPTTPVRAGPCPIRPALSARAEQRPRPVDESRRFRRPDPRRRRSPSRRHRGRCGGRPHLLDQHGRAEPQRRLDRAHRSRRRQSHRDHSAGRGLHAETAPSR